MKLVLSSMLLASLCTLSSWSVSSGELRVTQSPDVSVVEGEAANISCCWTGLHEEQWISFSVNYTTLKNHNFLATFIRKNHTNSSNCSTWTIENSKVEDSGIYVCKVTVHIPTLIEGEGKGTVVKVLPKDEQKQEKNEGSPPAIVAAAVLFPLLLIALTCSCLVWRQKRVRAAQVIYEVPHIDSDVDKHSTSSSRGSTQWCQVPMYESCNYFERVETKESG